MPWLEITGNLFIVLSVFLAARNHVLTWPIGIIGCILYGFMFYEAKLYADVTLQLFFIVTSVKGWWDWQHVGAKRLERPITRISWQSLCLLYFPASIAGTLLYGFILHGWTDASLPFIDSSVLAFSIAAQFLLMRRKLETWVFWIIVDIVSVPLFFYKELYLTSAVYSVFLVNAVYGLWSWHKIWKNQHDEDV